MNIHEAAQMLRTGCFMRRGGWHEGKHCGLDGFGLFIKANPFDQMQMHFCLSLDDLLADDWEIYIPMYPNKNNRPTFRPTSGNPDRPSFPPGPRLKSNANMAAVTVPPPKAVPKPQISLKKK